MKRKQIALWLPVVLLACSANAFAGDGISGKDPSKVDDNPSASDNINLKAADLASKQANKQSADISIETLESIKPSAPVIYTPQPYTPSATGNSLLDAWMGVKNGVNNSGLSVKTETITYVGDSGADQARVFNSDSLEGQYFAAKDASAGYGAVLTTGSANFSSTNTSSGFSNITNSGSSYYVSQISNQATYDANALKFSFTVAPGVNAVTTNFVFASEEYPEWTGLFRDGFAFIVDGVNYAKFDANTFVTLSDPGASTLANPIITEGSNRFLLDNRPDASGQQVAPMEYDGLTGVLSATGLLKDGLAVHTIEVVIADSNDQVWDSAVFLSNLRTFNDQAAPQLSAASFGLISAVPEPSAGMLIGLGLSLMGLSVLRQKRQA